MKPLLRAFAAVALILCIPLAVAAQDPVLRLKEAILDIQNQGEVGFRNFTLCSDIMGFGQYVNTAGNKIKAGSEALFYYEPANIHTKRDGVAYQIWFTQDMILYNAEGAEIFRSDEALNFNYQTRSPLLDVYARNSLSLGDLPPGKYVFEAVLHDKLKNAQASFKLPFEVVP